MLMQMSRERDKFYQLGPTESALPEDGDRIQSLKRVLNKMMMDNVQKYICIDVPSSQTFISYLCSPRGKIKKRVKLSL
jgi:hypothetical protein